MIPLYTPEQVRKLDAIAVRQLETPGLLLMENAANNLKHIFFELYPPDEFNKVAVICGKGNNGGDGFALARLLLVEGYDVLVYCLSREEELSPDAWAQFGIVKKLAGLYENLVIKKHATAKDLRLLEDREVIVDAMLGSGAKGPLTEPIAGIIKFVNNLNCERLAIDIPTGVDAESGQAELAFQANVTITLGGLKQGLFFSNGYAAAGEVYVAGIGIPDELLDEEEALSALLEPEDALYFFPEKKKAIHKFSAGSVLSIAGSKEYPGAALLTALAAFKVGAGASTLAFPESVAGIGHSQAEHHLIIKKYAEESGCLHAGALEALAADIEKAGVIALGPGLGRDVKTVEAVLELIREYPDKPMVIDADALYAIDWGSKSMDITKAIVTPHLGEFSQMLGVSVSQLRSNLIGFGGTFAKMFGCVLVLKDYRTLIFSPDGRVLIAPVGNSGLAKFGSGDVLTGILAGLYAQTGDPLSAAISGVYVHGLAADLLKEKNSIYGYTATDLLNEIPGTINFLIKSCI